MTFAPATDTVATAALNYGLCGEREYTVTFDSPTSDFQLGQPVTFNSPTNLATITAPTVGDPFTTNWALSIQSNNFDDVGTWTYSL